MRSCCQHLNKRPGRHVEHLATAATFFNHIGHRSHCTTAHKITVTFSKAHLLDFTCFFYFTLLVLRSDSETSADVDRKPSGSSQAPMCLLPIGFSLGLFVGILLKQFKNMALGVLGHTASGCRQSDAAFWVAGFQLQLEQLSYMHTKIL